MKQAHLLASAADLRMDSWQQRRTQQWRDRTIMRTFDIMFIAQRISRQCSARLSCRDDSAYLPTAPPRKMDMMCQETHQSRFSRRQTIGPSLLMYCLCNLRKRLWPKALHTAISETSGVVHGRCSVAGSIRKRALRLEHSAKHNARRTRLCSHTSGNKQCNDIGILGFTDCYDSISASFYRHSTILP